MRRLLNGDTIGQFTLENSREVPAEKRTPQFLFVSFPRAFFKTSVNTV